MLVAGREGVGNLQKKEKGIWVLSGSLNSRSEKKVEKEKEKEMVLIGGVHSSEEFESMSAGRRFCEEEVCQ